MLFFILEEFLRIFSNVFNSLINSLSKKRGTPVTDTANPAGLA